MREGLVWAGSCAVVLAGSCVKVLSWRTIALRSCLGGQFGEGLVFRRTMRRAVSNSRDFPSSRGAVSYIYLYPDREYVKSCTRERDSTAGAPEEKYLPFSRPQLLIRGGSSFFSPTTEQRVQDSSIHVHACTRTYAHARRKRARATR